MEGVLSATWARANQETAHWGQRSRAQAHTGPPRVPRRYAFSAQRAMEGTPAGEAQVCAREDGDGLALSLGLWGEWEAVQGDSWATLPAQSTQQLGLSQCGDLADRCRSLGCQSCSSAPSLPALASPPHSQRASVRLARAAALEGPERR